LSSILSKIFDCSDHFKIGFINSVLDTVTFLENQLSTEQAIPDDEITTNVANSPHHSMACANKSATGLLSDDERIDMAKPLLTNIWEKLTLPQDPSRAFDPMHNRFSHSLKEVNERASAVTNGTLNGPDLAQLVRHPLKLKVVDEVEIDRYLVAVIK
jgi:hypothetical protein